jgi:hypothetical protein
MQVGPLKPSLLHACREAHPQDIAKICADLHVVVLCAPHPNARLPLLCGRAAGKRFKLLRSHELKDTSLQALGRGNFMRLLCVFYVQ